MQGFMFRIEESHDIANHADGTAQPLGEYASQGTGKGQILTIVLDLEVHHHLAGVAPFMAMNRVS